MAANSHYQPSWQNQIKLYSSQVNPVNEPRWFSAVYKMLQKTKKSQPVYKKGISK